LTGIIIAIPILLDPQQPLGGGFALELVFQRRFYFFL